MWKLVFLQKMSSESNLKKEKKKTPYKYMYVLK